jgi:hypothetical protein
MTLTAKTRLQRSPEYRIRVSYMTIVAIRKGIGKLPDALPSLLALPTPFRTQIGCTETVFVAFRPFNVSSLWRWAAAPDTNAARPVVKTEAVTTVGVNLARFVLRYTGRLAANECDQVIGTDVGATVRVRRATRPNVRADGRLTDVVAAGAGAAVGVVLTSATDGRARRPSDTDIALAIAGATLG